MQWKLVHIGAVIVALALGWVARGLVMGKAGEPVNGGAAVASQPEERPPSTAAVPVEKLIDPEIAYLVVGRGSEETKDALWLLPSTPIGAIEPPAGMSVGVARLVPVASCTSWPECIDCRGKDPKECISPKPPPQPGLFVEHGGLPWVLPQLPGVP